MSAVIRKVRRLERHRAKVKCKKIPESAGAGKALARQARAINLRTEAARTKARGKLAGGLASLSAEELNKKLAETRKELFNLRFKHATGQLENVAGIPAARRHIARILTLIKQKEVGA